MVYEWKEGVKLEHYKPNIAKKILRRYLGDRVSNISSSKYMVTVNFKDIDTGLAFVIDYLNKGYKGLQYNVELEGANCYISVANLENYLDTIIEENYPEWKHFKQAKTETKSLDDFVG